MSEIAKKKLVPVAGEDLPLTQASFKGTLDHLTNGKLPETQEELAALLRQLPEKLHLIEPERWKPLPISEIGKPLLQLVSDSSDLDKFLRREETPYQLYLGYRLDIMELSITTSLYVHRDFLDGSTSESQFRYSLTGVIEHRAATFIESSEAEKVFHSVDKSSAVRARDFHN